VDLKGESSYQKVLVLEALIPESQLKNICLNPDDAPKARVPAEEQQPKA